VARCGVLHVCLLGLEVSATRVATYYIPARQSDSVATFANESGIFANVCSVSRVIRLTSFGRRL
jgi:hypothetical protein